MYTHVHILASYYVCIWIRSAHDILSSEQVSFEVRVDTKRVQKQQYQIKNGAILVLQRNDYY